MQTRPVHNALSDAAPGIVSRPGPGAPPSHRIPWPGEGPAAFKSRPPRLPWAGPNPHTGSDRLMRFIPPLALFNDASQWVDRLFFNRPMPFMQAPNSNPPLQAQYFTPPPQNAGNLAAGTLNLQAQLGSLRIQTAMLTDQASNYFGG